MGMVLPRGFSHQRRSPYQLVGQTAAQVIGFGRVIPQVGALPVAAWLATRVAT